MKFSFRRRRIQALEDRLQILASEFYRILGTGDPDGILAIWEDLGQIANEIDPYFLNEEEGSAKVMFDAAKLLVPINAALGRWTDTLTMGMALTLAFGRVSDEFEAARDVEGQRAAAQAVIGVAAMIAYAAHRTGAPGVFAFLNEAFYMNSLKSYGSKRALEDIDETTFWKLETLHRMSFQSTYNRGLLSGLYHFDWRNPSEGIEEQCRKMLRIFSGSPELWSHVTYGPIVPLFAGRASGRTLIYLAPLMEGGAAIVFRDAPDGKRLITSYELPDFRMPHVEELQATLRRIRSGVLGANHLEAGMVSVGRMIWEPLFRKDPSLLQERLAVLPMGSVSALPVTTSLVNGKILCELVDVTVVPTARSLLRAAMLTKHSGDGVCIAADPWVGSHQIFGVVTEAQEVAEVYGAKPFIVQRSMEGAGGSKKEVSYEPDIESPIRSRAELIEYVSRSSIVHLACHGLLNEKEPFDSRLLLGGNVTLRHFLDGRMTSGAVFILSACEAGSVTGPNPDEYVSFPGVLLNLGVRAIVAPLFPLPDTPDTAKVMKNLHMKMAEGHSTSRAVGLALTEARRQGISCEIWGSIVHFGV